MTFGQHFFIPIGDSDYCAFREGGTICGRPATSIHHQSDTLMRISLPELPDETTALIGTTGVRYTPYGHTASWVDATGQTYSLGQLLEREDELIVDCTPPVNPLDNLHAIRAAITSPEGYRPVDLLPLFERIEAALKAAEKR